MKRNLFRGFTGGGAAVAAALLLVGCTAAPATPAASEAAPAGSGELIPLTIVIAPVINEPLFYAVDSGIFEEHGLEVSLVTGGALPAQQVPALLSGEANIGMTGGLTLVAGVVEGLPVQAIAPIGLASDKVVSSNGFIVGPNSTHTGYADMAGTTIAVPGLNELPHLSVVYALKQAGVDPASVEFLEMPITNVNDAIANGQIDGAFQIGSFYSAAMGTGFKTFGSPANELFPGAVNMQLMATNDWIAANGPTIEKFNAALAESIEFLNANPEAIRDVQREHTELPDAVIDAAILPTYASSFDKAGYKRMIDTAIEFGFVNGKPTFEDVVWKGAPLK